MRGRLRPKKYQKKRLPDLDNITNQDYNIIEIGNIGNIGNVEKIMHVSLENTHLYTRRHKYLRLKKDAIYYLRAHNSGGKNA